MLNKLGLVDSKEDAAKTTYLQGPQTAEK